MMDLYHRQSSLLPNPEIDGGWRISNNCRFTVGMDRFWFCYVRVRPEVSVGVYGEAFDMLRLIIHGATKARGQDTSYYQTINLTIFNRDNVLAEVLDVINRPKVPEKFKKPYRGSLLSICQQLREYCNQLYRLSGDNFFNMRNKKYDVLIIPCFEDDFLNSETEGELVRVLHMARKCHILPILVANTPDIIPASVADCLSDEYFIGKESVDFFYDTYDIPVEPGKMNQVSCGIVMRKTVKNVIAREFAPTKPDLTEKYLISKFYTKAEKEAYSAYLEDLAKYGREQRGFYEE